MARLPFNYLYVGFGLSGGATFLDGYPWALVVMGSVDGLDFQPIGNLPAFSPSAGFWCRDLSAIYNPNSSEFFICYTRDTSPFAPHNAVSAPNSAFGLSKSADLVNWSEVTTNSTFVGNVDASWAILGAHNGGNPAITSARTGATVWGTGATLNATYTSAGGARTNIAVTALPYAMPTGATLTFPVATGTATVTLSAPAALGATTVSINSLGPAPGNPWDTGVALTPSAAIYTVSTLIAYLGNTYYCTTANGTGAVPTTDTAHWTPLTYVISGAWYFDGTNYGVVMNINEAVQFEFVPSDQTNFLTWNTGNSGSNPVIAIPSSAISGGFYNAEIFDTGVAGSTRYHSWATTVFGTSTHLTAAARTGPWTVQRTGLFSQSENAHVVQLDSTPNFALYNNGTASGVYQLQRQTCSGLSDLLADNWSAVTACTVGNGALLTSDSAGVYAVGLSTSPDYNAAGAAVLNAAPLSQRIPVRPGG